MAGRAVLIAPFLVAGIGCRRECPAADILAAIRAAEAEAGTAVAALAVPAFKQDEPGVAEAASVLRLPVHVISDAALASVQALCPTRSEVAEAATGFASVAEAAALAAAGGTLLVRRLTQGGATCAIAAS